MNFKEDLKNLNIELDSVMEERFKTYYEFLVDYNEKVNLTAITDLEGVYYKHFYDSLVLSQAYDFSKPVSCLDVGAGAGFPSIPNAIVYKNLDVTIIDALNKRISFLNELSKKLGLSNVHPLHQRAEEHAKDKREFYDVVTARAVARLNVLSELCLPLVKVGGYFLAMKSQETDEELKEASNAIKVLGGKIIEVKNVELPYSLGKRTVVIIKKEGPSPKKYPRQFSQIKNKPL